MTPREERAFADNLDAVVEDTCGVRPAFLAARRYVAVEVPTGHVVFDRHLGRPLFAEEVAGISPDDLRAGLPH